MCSFGALRTGMGSSVTFPHPLQTVPSLYLLLPPLLSVCGMWASGYAFSSVSLSVFAFRFVCLAPKLLLFGLGGHSYSSSTCYF